MPRGKRQAPSDSASASQAKLPKPEVHGEELSNAAIRQELMRLGQSPGPVDDGNRLAATVVGDRGARVAALKYTCNCVNACSTQCHSFSWSF